MSCSWVAVTVYTIGGCHHNTVLVSCSHGVVMSLTRSEDNMLDKNDLQQIAGMPVEMGPELRWCDLKAGDIVCIAPALYNTPETVFKFAAEVREVIRNVDRHGKINVKWMWLWSKTSSWPKLFDGDQSRFETWSYIVGESDVGYPVIRGDKLIIPVNTWRIWKVIA
jgi:hypothetical protein